MQYKLDLFQIDMCRHRVPPCTYREHLYMNMDELSELFEANDVGTQSDGGTVLQKNWLFKRAEYREHLRDNFDENDDDDESVDEKYVIDDDDYNDDYAYAIFDEE